MSENKKTPGYIPLTVHSLSGYSATYQEEGSSNATPGKSNNRNGSKNNNNKRGTKRPSNGSNGSPRSTNRASSGDKRRRSAKPEPKVEAAA